MIILPNGVAAIKGDVCHLPWVRDEGLVHDKFTADILTKVIRDRNVQLCVDAGANIGTITRAMLDAGARVHAFECNPKAVECLHHNCHEATIHPVGLSDRRASLYFNRLDNAGASYVSEVGAPGAERVILLPLDLYGLSPGLIKLDVEGFEYRMLQGARETIDRSRPVIFTEVNAGALARAGSSEDELLRLLEDLNYTFSIVQPDCVHGSPQYDILAIPLT